MADELDGNTSTDEIPDTSTDTPDVDTQADVSTQPEMSEAPKDDFKDIMSEEMQKKGFEGQDGQPKSPFEGQEEYFAKNEIEAIKSAPIEAQNAFAAIMDRFSAVANKRYEEVEARVASADQVYDLTKGLESTLSDYGYSTRADYFSHLVDFDREFSTNAIQAVATLIYGHAGGTQESLEEFVSLLEGEIYAMQDREQAAYKDPGYRTVIQQYRAAKNDAEAYRREHAADQQILQERLDSEYNAAFKLFEEAKDARGNLMYPLFNQVASRMGEIANQTGEWDLEKLYYMAVAENPDTRRSLGKTPQKTSLAMTNSPAGTSRSSGSKLPSFKECWDSAVAEKGMGGVYD